MLLLLPCVASAQDPEAVVRKLFADFWNGADVGNVQELMAPATTAHTAFLGEEGRTINPGQARAWRVRMAAWASGVPAAIRAAVSSARGRPTRFGRAAASCWRGRVTRSWVIGTLAGMGHGLGGFGRDRSRPRAFT